MPNIKFTYEGIETTYSCKIIERIKDICQIYVSKENLDINKLIFLYNGSEVNKEKSIEEIINEEDRKRESMNILVFHIYEDVKSNNIIKSNEVICPECKESAFIQLKDFKIDLFGCKNGHKMHNLSLQDYENLQMWIFLKLYANLVELEIKELYIIMNFIDVLYANLIYVQIVN